MELLVSEMISSSRGGFSLQILHHIKYWDKIKYINLGKPSSLENP